MFFRGQIIGKYKILSTIGSGGFGTVYLAEDTWIDKKVALKVPHKQGVDFGELLLQTVGPSKAPADSVGAWRPRPTDGPLAFAGKLRVMCQLGYLDDARADLATLEDDALRNIPRSRDYLAQIGHIAFACVETRSTRHAPVLYELLAPYPELCIAASSLHSYGPVSRMLAQLAQLLGEPERAAAHFERALLDAERYGLNPQLALTRLQYAGLLRELGGEARLSQARLLSNAARSLAERLGMQPLAAASRQLQAALG